MLVPYKKIYFGDDSHSLIKSPYQDGGEMTIFRESNKIVGGAGVPPVPSGAPPVPSGVPPVPSGAPPVPSGVPPGAPPGALPGAPPGLPPGADVKPPPNALSTLKTIAIFLKKFIFFLIRFTVKTTYNIVDSPNYIHKNFKKNGVLRVLGLDEENPSDTDKIRIKCNKELVNKKSTISTLEEYQERIMESKVDIDTLKKELKNSDFSTKSSKDLKIQGGGGEMPTDNMINFFIGYDNDDVLKGGSFIKNAAKRTKAAAIKAKESAVAKATQAKESTMAKATKTKEDAKAAVANAKERTEEKFAKAKEDAKAAVANAKERTKEKLAKAKEDAKASAKEAANKMKEGAKATANAAANKMKGLGNAMFSSITSLGEDDHEEECEEKAKEKEEEEKEENEDDKEKEKKSKLSAFYELVTNVASHFAMTLGIIEVPEGLYSVDQLKVLYMDTTCPEDIKEAIDKSFSDRIDVLNALDAIDLLKRIVKTEPFEKITPEELKSFYKMSLEEIEKAKEAVEVFEKMDKGEGIFQDDINNLKTTEDIKKIKSLIIKLLTKTVATGENFATTVGLLQKQDLNTGFNALQKYLQSFMLYSEKSLEEAQEEESRKQMLKDPSMNMGQSGGRFDIDADIRELSKGDREEYRDSLGLKRVLEVNFLRIENEDLMSPMVKNLLKLIYYGIEKYDLENQLISYYLSLRQGALPEIQKDIEKINKKIQEKEKLLDTYSKYQKSRDTDDAIMSNTKKLDKLYLEMKEYYKIEYDERIKVNNSEEIERMEKLTPAPCCNNIKLKNDSKQNMQSPLCYDELPCSENDIESSSKEEEEKILNDENIPCRDKPKTNSNGEDDDEDEPVHCPIAGGKKITHKKEVDLLDFL